MQTSYAQLGFCSGNSGNPIFTETFGTGVGQSPLPAGTTTYAYSNGADPDDGFYTVSNTTNYFDWFVIQDHTFNDINGKMLVINSDINSGEFYKTTINGLCENTSYEFSSWLINLTPSSGFCGPGAIPINVSFEIWDNSDTNLLASGATGNIGSTSSPLWRQYGLVFQTLPGQTSVILKMKNNGVGGCGNDLAIDDIVFKTCGDSVVIANANGTTTLELCEDTSVSNVPLTAYPDFSVFTSHSYQWQVSSDGISWTDITGAITNTYNAPIVIGTYYYRVKFAEFVGNVQNSSCNSLSDAFMLTINQEEIPIFNAIQPICAGDTITLPSTSNNAVSGIWSPAINNTTTTTYIFTPNSGECATTQTLTVVVNQPITPSFNPVAPICSGESISPLPTVSTNGISGSWSPAIDNTATTTYTFIPSAGQCAINQTLTIIVNQPSSAPIFNSIEPICAGDALSPLPTVSNNGIIGTWSPGLDNTTTTTYTFTPAAGECATSTTITITVSPIITPTFDSMSPICFGDTLTLPSTSNNGISGVWSPMVNNTNTTTYIFTPDAGECSTTTTLTITVNSIITPTFDAVAPICSGESFSLPQTSNNGIQGVWSPAINNTATTLYTFTPNSDECATIQTLTVVVNPATVPLFNPVPSICSGESLAPLPTTSTNGIVGTWSPALNNTTTTTYTFTPVVGVCGTSQTLTIIINPAVQPTFNPIAPICNGETINQLPTTSTNGITGVWSPALNNTETTTYTFTPNPGQCAATENLTIIVNPITSPTFDPISPICSGDAISPLPNISTNGINGTWSPAIDNTMTTTYTFTPSTGQCATVQVLTIVVNEPIIPIFDMVPAICAGETILPLPTTSTNGITGNWSPELDNSTTTTYIFTPDVGDCVLTTSLTITVDQLPSFDIDETYLLCVNTNETEVVQSPNINTNLSITDYSFVWMNDVGEVVSTNSSYEPMVSGGYSVIVTNLLTGCQNEDFTTVIESSPPMLEVIMTTEPFNSNAAIEVSALGVGIYEFSLDNGPWQDSPIFNNVTLGEHVVSARDKNGCGVSSIETCVIGLPKFFTPNGDNVNETWQVKGSSCLEYANVYIFDRFGKLLKQFDLNSSGWNGIFNGENLPTSDYWYVISFKETDSDVLKEYKGHFALKR